MNIELGSGLIDLSSFEEEEEQVKDTLTDGDKALLRLVYRDAHRLYIETPTAENFQTRRSLIQSIANRLTTILGEPPDIQRGDK